jgi:hypothetical protein
VTQASAPTCPAAPAGGEAAAFLLGVTTLPAGAQPDLRANRSAGVGLDATGISWTLRNQPQHRRYADIRGIELEWEDSDSDGGSSANAVALCTIAFSDGTALIVSSGPGVFRWLGRIRGVPHAAGLPQYREFVLELHQRLDPDAPSRVAFHYGGKPYKLGIRLVAHAVWGGGTVVLPAVLAIAVEMPGLLLVSLIGGATAAWMEFAMTRAPRPYSPGAIPRLALPP